MGEASSARRAWRRRQRQEHFATRHRAGPLARSGPLSGTRRTLGTAPACVRTVRQVGPHWRRAKVEWSGSCEIVRRSLEQFPTAPLAALVDQTIDDGRMLLLVDGLDEWSNEQAARTTLSALVTTVEAHDIPVIVSSRPRGLERIGALPAAWRRGLVAPLSVAQQTASPLAGSRGSRAIGRRRRKFRAPACAPTASWRSWLSRRESVNACEHAAFADRPGDPGAPRPDPPANARAMSTTSLSADPAGGSPRAIAPQPLATRSHASDTPPTPSNVAQRVARLAFVICEQSRRCCDACSSVARDIVTGVPGIPVARLRKRVGSHRGRGRRDPVLSVNAWRRKDSS